MKKKRIVHVIAGANGSGKTTFAMRYLPKMAACRNFVNADLIASGLSPLNVGAGAMQAGRLFLQRIEEEIRNKRDFAFETTLSGRRLRGLFNRLREKGYRIRLYFLWISTVDLALKRVSDRVRMGGHSVPARVVRRRYGRGIQNLFKIYARLADYCAIFDNSSTSPVLICEYIRGREHIVRASSFDDIRRHAEGIS